MTTHRRLLSLARTIDPARAGALAARYASWPSEAAACLATLVVTAFPPFAAVAEREPALFVEVATEGFRGARDRATYLRRLLAKTGDLGDEIAFRRQLRRFATVERIRIAARELCPPRLGGADVDVTAREVSDLAEATIDVALREAEHAIASRNGRPVRSDGAPSTMVVLGMGKLGGRELNVGSDVDLLYVYDTDDGAPAARETLHEHWGRVARRLTATLDDPTEDGAVWRVDLRLRPEGSRGAIVNSVAAAERYYEGWGRPWERAALLRARPVAGDLELGQALLGELSPFVWRRRLDPGIAVELGRLLARGRDELTDAPESDLKLGEGGIREAEFFVQALQLVWGGQEPSVRVPGMLAALVRLRARGLVTDREMREIVEAYLLLRRVEHRVQWTTGVQTHTLPDDPTVRGRIARSLGMPDTAALEESLTHARSRVAARFRSLLPEDSPPDSPFAAVVALCAEQDVDGATALLEKLSPGIPADGVARDLSFLGRRPDDPLGTATAEKYPAFGAALIASVVDSADPELCARNLRATFARVITPAVYVAPMAEDGRALRRLTTALGASAFVGQYVAHHPELRDRVLFAEPPPTPRAAADDVVADARRTWDESNGEADAEDMVGALRSAKLRGTLAVALGDLAGELDTFAATRVLSAIADATVGVTVSLAAGTFPEAGRGLAAIALGKLGGNDLGYGSDLDVIFLFDPDAAPPGVDPHEHFARLAQRVTRWISTPHHRGPGYELDTRLRPSGSQGTLVTSLGAFARYHGASDERSSSTAAAWERQALLRARFCAGDAELGARAIAIATAAAYEGGAPDGAELHRMRLRMELELGKERPGRYNLKTGHGGVTDIEFAVQLLQMRHGRDRRIRTTETARALSALETSGYLPGRLADVLAEGYRFLRRLEQRIHIVHGSSAHFVDEQAPGLPQLARRMGLRPSADATPAEALVALYLDVTERVRAAYTEVLGVPNEPRLHMTPIPMG
jgi:glutamate-ammonia-ligase adenylyltransferase